MKKQTIFQVESLSLNLFEDILSNVHKELKKELFNELKQIHFSMISRSDACRVLNISKPTIIAMEKRGDITGYRIKGSVKYKYSEIEQYVQSRIIKTRSHEG